MKCGIRGSCWSIRSRAGGFLWAYTYSLLHRSEDGGRTWTTTRIEPASFRPRTISLATRNMLQLADGSLLLGISEHAPHCRSLVLRSTHVGKTWSETYPAHFADVPADYPYTLFGEAHLWQAQSGKLYAILRLGEDRLLLTFTQRDIEPPLGVRAVLGREMNDGFEFDMDHDQIMIDTKTPAGVSSGGGFGPTLLLGDGTLITSYTYRDADDLKHAEVVRWRMP